MKTKNNKFSIKGRLDSFKYAFDGFKALIKDEHNARIHLTVTVLVILLGFLMKINALEWALIIFAIGLVFVAEIFNTCIERICDFVYPEQSVKIKKIKDLAALAVLFSVISAVVVGLVIFVPKLIAIFS